MQIFLWVLLLIVLAEVMSLRKRIKKLEESNPKGQETEKLRTRKGEIREEVRVPSFTQDLKEEPIATRIAAVSEKKEVKEPPGEFVAEYRKVADARDFFPAPPGPIDKFLEQLKAFFTTGNIVLKVGIIILFFGVAFLLKYAAQRNLFPIEFRLAGVAVFGLSLLIAGWRLRARVLLYGLTLQGGGVGILYLTVFAASKLYHFLPPTLSLVIMVGLVGLSGALAVMQDAKALAIFGITGGFLAPVLMSTGSGSHVMLFSYYALLNAGILGIAWFKAWRVLNLLGFVFTFVIASFWGSNYYQPDYFSTTEPFLVLFFVFYVAISVLFAHRQPPKLKGFIDGPLVFGVSLVSFALQACLVKDFEYGLAISACAAGLFYILLATILWRRLTEGMRMLTEAFLAIGVVFGSLAIPLALDGHWTATAWALEGGAMVWVGVRQKRLGARVFGVLLQFGSGISFLIAACTPPPTALFLNSYFFGCFFISIAGLFSSYYLTHHHDKLHKNEEIVPIPLLVWGLLWWFGGGIGDLHRHFFHKDFYDVSLLFFSISFLAMAIVAKRLTWRHLSSTLLCFFPALVILVPFSLNDFSLHVHLLTQWSSIAWLPAILLQYRIMWQFEDEWPSQAIPLWHLGTMWFVIFVLSLETAWAVDYLIQGEEIWPLICWGLVPGALVLALIRKGGAFPWPVKKHANQYLDNGISVPVCFLLLWLLITCTQEGRPGPLPYLPLINPLELAQFFVFYVLIVYVWTGTRKPYALQAEFPEYTGIMVLGGVVFVWLNSVVARIVSNYSHTSFEARSLFSSDVFQAGISGLWTLIAMAITVWATRKGNRPVWMTGSVLLGMVVLKLFIVDLSGIGTIARIVSFLVVGVLMLLIGYFSPLPPKIMENSK